MQKNSFPLIFQRNIGTITEKEQRKLNDACVAIIGLGGIGGILFETLVRSGVGRFILMDSDIFELSNLNRQILSSMRNLGKEKTQIALERGKEINPEVRIEAYSKLFSEKDLRTIKPADVVADGLDNVYSRIVLSRSARKFKIPYIFGAVEYGKGISTVFLPGKKSYEEIFARSMKGKRFSQIKEKSSVYPKGMSVIGPVPNMVGCFEAMQAINLILKKPVVEYPEFLNVDMFSRPQVRIGSL